MLGDSPGTDILGANRQGWSSVLIETGNHRFGEDLEGSRANFRFKDLVAFKEKLDKGFFHLQT
jgi:ribonucleotide monophosphatase NagD (HAD superfamily)